MSIPNRTLDIPLLRAFVAIYETGSVTIAADHLALTQPTLSYALSKLRHALDDPLFVREGRTLTPTRRAQECFGKFKEILMQLDELTDHHTPFDASQSTRTFNLAMSDIGAISFLPPLLKVLQTDAPHIRIKTQQMATDTIPEALATGKIDAAIGNFPPLGPATDNAMLERGEYACLLASDHPWIENSLSMEDFLRARHIHVSSELTTHKHLENMLRDAGMTRNIALEVQQFTTVPSLIRSTDLISVLPRSVGHMFLPQGGLKLLPLPTELPGYDIRIHWHHQLRPNSPQMWLVKQFIDTWRNRLTH